ncbi:ATP-binding protein [Solirubrobacter soli]|uniref:ATP-binding protein n=1 Tax=Solirubrobacter soli TaxID=363832 RepID=UPI000A0230E0|nr:ATP-binding protein [Solirubrobacter soli]
MRQVAPAHLLDVDLPAEPQSVSLARRAVLDALTGIAVDRDAVGVVVSEAVTNAVLHAYRDRERPGAVRVTADLHEEGVEVSVTDDGLGMHPRTDSPGVGLGMPLIADLADSVIISSKGKGTCVAAHFLLMGAAGPHGRPVARTVAGRAERQAARLVAV